MESTDIKELILSFKTFFENSVLPTASLQLQKQWQVFNHFLSIFPLHKNQLASYSQICANPLLEQQFIVDNCISVVFDSQQQKHKSNLEEGKCVLNKVDYNVQKPLNPKFMSYQSQKDNHFVDKIWSQNHTPQNDHNKYYKSPPLVSDFGFEQARNIENTNVFDLIKIKNIKIGDEAKKLTYKLNSGLCQAELRKMLNLLKIDNKDLEYLSSRIHKNKIDSYLKEDILKQSIYNEEALKRVNLDQLFNWNGV